MTGTARAARPDNDRLRVVLNVVLAVTQMMMPYMARATGVGVPIDEQFSNETWVTPAGYAFSIWGFIFPACLAYAAYHARARESALPRRVGWLTAAVFIACTAWAVAAQLQVLWLTVILIAAMLAGLVAALVRITRHPAPLTRGERWLVAMPVGVYAEWITVAAVANAASALEWYGFQGGGIPGPVWGIALLVVVGAVGAFVTLRTRGSAGYALAVVWALVAISAATVRAGPEVAAAAGAAAVLVLLALLRGRTAPRAPAPG